MSQPFTTVHDVLAELDTLHQLHAEHEQRHADAAAAAAEAITATPDINTGEDAVNQ